MDDLIKQLLLLSSADRKKLAGILNASLEDLGEGFFYSFEDFTQSQNEIIQQRLTDIELEKECLIEFDDHLFSIK